MARSTTPAGIGYKDKHDLNDKVFTPADSEFVAITVDSAVRGVHTELDRVKELAEAVLAMSGIGPTSPVDAQTAALINQAETLTRKAVNAVVETAKVSAFGVRVDAYGVVGDGVTDDTTAFHAAAAAAATAGVPLVIPAGFSIGISSYKQLPDGLILVTNGSSFQQIVPMGRNPVVGLGSRCQVLGGLYVRTLGGDNCQGVHVPPASNGASVDVIDVRSSASGAGAATVYDNGVRILGSNFTCGRIVVEGYTWPVWVQGYGHEIGWLEVKEYSLAVRLYDTKHLRIHGGRVYGTSPTTAYKAGYNGVLIEASAPDAVDGVHVSNFRVEDAGEHGYRVGGQNSVRNVTFTRCVAKNVGGSGFKTLPGPAGDAGNSVRATGVVLDHCTVEDAGDINQNCSGFLIQRADDVRITAPSIRKKDKLFSAVEGIRMSGVTHVTVTDAKVRDTKNFGVHLDEAYGNVSDIRVTGHIETTTGQGVYLQNPGVQFRDIHVDMYVENTTVGGSAFYAGRATAAEDSGSWAGMNTLRLTISESTPSPTSINPNSSSTALSAFFADVIGRRAWIVPFRAGSMWTDTRTLTRQVKRADDWAVL